MTLTPKREQQLLAQIDRLRRALEDVLNSEALKEAPLYCYSEAIIRAREALNGTKV